MKNRPYVVEHHDPLLDVWIIASDENGKMLPNFKTESEAVRAVVHLRIKHGGKRQFRIRELDGPAYKD